MKKCIIWFIPAVIIVIIIGFFIINNNDKVPYFNVNLNGVIHKVELSQSPIVQKCERIFHNKSIRLSFEIGAKNDTILYAPINVKTDKDGYIYVQDTAVRTIKKFTKEGKFLCKYGRPGDGPGEFSLLSDFCFDQNNRLYVLDYRKIAIFDSLGVKEIKLKVFGIQNIFTPSKRDIILLRGPTKDREENIVKLSSDSEEISYLERLFKSNISGQHAFGHIFCGDILDFTDKIVFIPQYFNLIYFYKDNKVSKVITTIDAETHPEVNVTTRNDVIMNSERHLNEIVINKTSYIINDSLYVFSKPAFKKHKDIMFDVYDKEGKYCHTVKFNLSEKFIAKPYLTNNRLIIITDKWIVKVYDY